MQTIVEQSPLRYHEVKDLSKSNPDHMKHLQDRQMLFDENPKEGKKYGIVKHSQAYINEQAIYVLSLDLNEPKDKTEFDRRQKIYDRNTKKGYVLGIRSHSKQYLRDRNVEYAREYRRKTQTLAQKHEIIKKDIERKKRMFQEMTDEKKDEYRKRNALAVKRYHERKKQKFEKQEDGLYSKDNIKAYPTTEAELIKVIFGDKRACNKHFVSIVTKIDGMFASERETIDTRKKDECGVYVYSKEERHNKWAMDKAGVADPNLMLKNSKVAKYEKWALLNAYTIDPSDRRFKRYGDDEYRSWVAHKFQHMKYEVENNLLKYDDYFIPPIFAFRRIAMEGGYRICQLLERMFYVSIENDHKTTRWGPHIVYPGDFEKFWIKDLRFCENLEKRARCKFALGECSVLKGEMVKEFTDIEVRGKEEED